MSLTEFILVNRPFQMYFQSKMGAIRKSDHIRTNALILQNLKNRTHKFGGGDIDAKVAGFSNLRTSVDCGQQDFLGHPWFILPIVRNGQVSKYTFYVYASKQADGEVSWA